MSEFTAGAGQFHFSDTEPADVRMELSIYIEELSEARKRALEITPTFRDRVGIPPVETMPELIAEYTNAIYGIDRYDSSVITRAQLANLVFINKQSKEMLAPGNKIPHNSYGMMLTSTSWASEPIEDIGQDMSYIDGVRKVATELSPQKAMAVNMMRFAARVWLNRFSEEEKPSAKFGAAVIFGTLFEDSYRKDILSNPLMHELSPEDAYLAKQEAYENLSEYCFAGVPMNHLEARNFAVMSRNINIF